MAIDTTSKKKGGASRRRLFFWLSAGAAAGGLALVGAALWTPLKAELGQYLIAEAYVSAQAKTRAAGGAARGTVKPWAWADIAPLAKLRFPSLGGAERLVLDQASGEAMAWGPGWMRGSAPLGEAGLSAVAAHRDTHFALLEDLKPGDPIELETLSGARARYRMVRGEVVDSRIWRLPALHDGPDVLALSTCWPFGSVLDGPMRYVVFAVREERGPDAS